MSKSILRIISLLLVACLLADASLAHSQSISLVAEHTAQSIHFDDQALTLMLGSVTGKTKEMWSRLLVWWRRQEEPKPVVYPADSPLGIPRWTEQGDVYANTLSGDIPLKEWFEGLKKTHMGRDKRLWLLKTSFEAFQAAYSGQSDKLARLIAIQITPREAVATYFGEYLKGDPIQWLFAERVARLDRPFNKRRRAMSFAREAVNEMIDIMFLQNYFLYFVPGHPSPVKGERYERLLRNEVMSWMPELEKLLMNRMLRLITHGEYLELVDEVLEQIVSRYTQYHYAITENKILTRGPSEPAPLAPAPVFLRQLRYIDANLWVGDKKAAQSPPPFIQAVLYIPDDSSAELSLSAEYIQKTVAWINSQLSEQKSVLVACDTGRSLSASMAVAWLFLNDPTLTYSQALEKVRQQIRDVSPLASLQGIVESIPRLQKPQAAPQPIPAFDFLLAVREMLARFRVKDLNMQMRLTELWNFFTMVSRVVYRGSREGVRAQAAEVKRQILSGREALPELARIGLDVIGLGKRLDRLLLAAPILSRVFAAVSLFVGVVFFGVFADLASSTAGISRIVMLASTVIVGISMGLIGAWAASIEHRLWGLKISRRKPLDMSWNQIKRHVVFDPLPWRETVQESTLWAFWQNPFLRRIIPGMVLLIYIRSVLDSDAMALFLNAWHEIPLIMVFIALPFVSLVGFAVSWHFAPVLFLAFTGRKLTLQQVVHGFQRLASRAYRISGIKPLILRGSLSLASLRDSLKAWRWELVMLFTLFSVILPVVLYAALNFRHGWNYAPLLLIGALGMATVAFGPWVWSLWMAHYHSLRQRPGPLTFRRMRRVVTFVTFIALAFPQPLEGKPRLPSAA